MNGAMHVGVFQLLPQPETVSDREVIEQALWEADFADAAGYDSVWVTEHHLSPFGLIGAPSVYAAALAQRTRRIRIGYAVAVVPLHHPLRLAEELLWVDHLSEGRLLVGVGPGFSAYEFGAFGVPLEERHGRLDEGLEILRSAFASPSLSHSGRYWTIPAVTPKPRPYSKTGPPLFRAISSVESLRRAAAEGTPVMLGLKSIGEIAELVALYREVRARLGRTPGQIDDEVAELRVLRRIVVGASDQEALAQAHQALAWERETARRVHEAGPPSRTPPTLADGSQVAAATSLEGGCVGTPATVREGLLELHALGIRHVIAWMNFGDLPYASVRASMELMATRILPELTTLDPLHAAMVAARS
ncbi:MAG TPA: LLM class flavin-dependent oxidoreductase [Thermoanaerobaculia bacterium]|jgi:alkanesulfonate monooxygenase SsuD/methylene tetrahydromethanopterin reductase-like flavin-dependent oxidoreductase (luciferase family)|nr:LLM class flavin-dependent oxidoreductase [Thermoanaerobaculia bacterium]